MDQLHREEQEPLLKSFLRGPAAGVTRRQGTGREIRPRRLAAFGAPLLVLGAIGCAPSSEQSPAPVAATGVDSATVAAEVIEVLQASVDAWNRNDLPGFLGSYTDDPTLAFVGATGVRRGKSEVEESYRSSYFSGEGEADDLAFDQLEVRPLGPGYALAHGRWTLFEPGFETQPVSGQGRFTLVLRLEGGQWRIMHDHSS